MPKFILAIVTPLVVAGCVSTTEIVPAGRDTFMVSTTASDVVSGQAPIASVKAANKYCESRDQHMIIRRTDSLVRGLGPSMNTLVLSCVGETDPEYQRPNLRHDPNVIIDDHR
jgi:hypothetical protein